MWIKKTIPILCLTVLLATTDAARRTRVRPARIEQDDQYENDYDNGESGNQQYFNEPQQKRQNQVIVADDEYNGLYGQQNSNQRQQLQDRYFAPASPTKTPIPAARTKDQTTKAAPVQTLRNYNKVNDDGSFTFGYEAADGSFKEETRGTDCVVRGKYGYVDPDGNKREFTYVSGNPCDPNNPDGQDEPESEENPDEPENIPNLQNYPKRPPVRIQNTPSPRPPPTTTGRAPTTVFQNNYNINHNEDEESEEEEPEIIQKYVPQPQQQQQPQPARVNNSPFGQSNYNAPQDNSGFRVASQRPVVTTPSPINYNTSPVHAISITPRPTYRTSAQAYQTQPPATTYRPPQPQRLAQKQVVNPSHLSVIPVTTPFSVSKLTKSSANSPLNFAEEFQKFQQEHNILTTTNHPTVQSQNQGGKFKVANPATSNPIYESQLVFDPQTGQYDSALYQQLPQTNGDFSISQRIQPYVHQLQQTNTPQLVNLQQLQQKSPLYQKPAPLQRNPSTIVPQIPQFSQQIYQKQNDNLQVFNSQQLFEQQQELQQAQLQFDRIEAAKRHQQTNHRLPVQPQGFGTSGPQTQSFYYIQPQGQTTGQIDAFLRGHNLDY